MASETSIWFRLGYAMETARRARSRAGRRLAGLAERTRGSAAAGEPTRAAAQAAVPEKARERPREEEAASPFDELLWTAAAALAGRLLDAWRPRRRPGAFGLLRAGVAGGLAALALELLEPLLDGRGERPALDREAGERILAGVGQGLLYGAVLEPRVPGPAALKGVLFGSAEYAADPSGGLSKLLAAHAPLAGVPLVGGLVEGRARPGRRYLEHLVFGVTLAMLYGSSRSSNGMAVAGEDGEA